MDSKPLFRKFKKSARGHYSHVRCDYDDLAHFLLLEEYNCIQIILLLEDKMNADTGKRLAQKRHEYLESFHEEFIAEWNGER